jgi:hypothetical protein
MKKKVLLLSVAALAVAALAVGGTLAYLMGNTETATNTFALGNVTISISENDGDNDPDWDGENGEKATNVPIVPGQLVDKAPKITNELGSSNAYVRLIVGGGIENYDIDYNEYDAESGGAGWIQDMENMNVWYYSEVLAPGATTNPALFDTVTLKGSIVTIDDDDLTITVYGEAIQADYLQNADGEVTDVIEAFEIFDTQQEDL